MTQKALGLIEVIGLPAAIEAADTCLKASNTQLIGYEKVTSGLITVKIQGDVGAVKAAIETAKVSAAKIGQVVSTLVIPRPALGIQGVISSSETVLAKEENHETNISNEIKNLNLDVESIAKADDSMEPAGDSGEIAMLEMDTLTPHSQVEIEVITGLSPMEEIQSEDQENNKPEEFKHEPQNGNYSGQGYTCNLCHDPNCPREKGQPRNQCIHNKENQ